MSQSILLSSFQNINLNSPNDLAKIKESVIKKTNKGCFPIFLPPHNEKPLFHFVKIETTLKNVLENHFMSSGATNRGDNYRFFNIL